MARRATAQDVANLVGVSRSSVSLVLNGRSDGNISAVKQRAILEAANQLNYRPNTLAQSLRSSRTFTLGLLTWMGRSGLPQLMLHMASEKATAAGFASIWMDIGRDPAQEAKAISSLLDRQVDAVLVVAPELVAYEPPEALAGTRTLLVNCHDPERRVTSVVPDEFAGAGRAAHILLDRGHTRIALLAEDDPAAQLRDRVTGVRAALAGAGQPPPLVIPAADLRSGTTAIRAVLRRPGAPTAVICTRERLALATVLAATELQLRIPDDLSLISLEDGEQLAPDLVPSVATIQRPDIAMAEQAVALLLQELTSEQDAAVRQLSFVCPPQLRASVGTPRRGT